MASLALLNVDEEQRNFFSLTILLFDVGNDTLRAYFKKQWPIVYQKVKGTSPPLPWSDLPSDATEMTNIETKLKLKRNEKLKFDSGDTRKWDFSLLSTVLLHSSLGFISQPHEKKALEDLKEMRNDLVGHIARCKIDDSEFKSAWTDTCNALMLFGASQTDFDSVQDEIKKPSDVLVPILKQLITKEDDIGQMISEIIDKMEKHHREIMDKTTQDRDELKETIKEEGQLTRMLVKECVGGHPPRHILMKEDQRRLLEQRLPHFQDDVTPTDLFDNLPCLTNEQKDIISKDEKNYRPSKAVKTLIEKLEEHEEGFSQFVQALHRADLGHVAVLLDADTEGYKCDDNTKANDVIKYYTVVGTAVDVMLPICILDRAKKIRNHNIEEQIASSFSKSSSSDSKTLRNVLQKVLPNGLYFVHTKQLGSHESIKESNVRTNSLQTNKKDCVVLVFRVAKVSVLDELWKLYQEKHLKEKLYQVLLTNKSINWTFSLEIFFQEKDYLAVKRLLEGEELVETETTSEKELPISVQGEELVETETTSEKELPISVQDEESLKLNIAASLEVRRETSIPRVYLDDDTYNLSREIKLRDYQKELAAPALEGKNTIICAPTNSGKTFVAMKIAKRHLDSCKDSTNRACKPIISKPKVIFIVDKQNLVLQQRARFDEYLTNYGISDISGNNSDLLPLYCLMQDNDIVVLTAQILLNALRDKSVCITDISLLVFDECHHANKDHPYNQIMQEYLRLKVEKNVKELPQVIGLTASLGVGQSNTETKAQEHILQMCANLDATDISTVRENTKDLINHVTGHVPVRRVIPSVNLDIQNIFEIEINKTMKAIEEFVNKLRPNAQVFPAFPTDRQCEGYRQWVELLQNNPEITDNRTRFTCAEQLRKYHEALLINNTVRIDDALQYLAEYFDKLDQSKFTEKCAQLQTLYTETVNRIQDSINENGNPDNPQLKCLEKLIIEFHEKKEETEAKGILFTRTRDYTVALKRWINETKGLDKILRPEVLVGSGDGDIGLSQTQQESVIKKFKSGDINIIIATTVAEEGLDISDCSYVIRYGMLGNEIASVQSRGRIRAKEGDYVYVPDSRRKGVEHERRNDFREMLMDSALQGVQNMDKKLFLEWIFGLQLKILNDLQIEKEKEASRKSQFKAEDYFSFHCKKCETRVCSTREIRRYKSTNHLVVNPNVDKLFVVKEREVPEGHLGRFNKLKVHCKECDLDWGIILLTKGVRWMCLKIEQFWIVVNDCTDAGMKREFKKWKKVPFDIKDATLEELFQLRNKFTQDQ